MASVLSKAQLWPAGNNRLLPSVRPITTLLATGIVWVTGLLVACSIAAGYLRQQVLTTTADELRRLDTVVAAATTRSLQDLDPVLESLADRLRRQGDAASLLQQAIGQSQPFDAIALIGADGKVTVEVTLKQAQWVETKKEDKTQVWTPLGEVKGLPFSKSVSKPLKVAG